MIKGLLQRGQLVLPRHPELLKQLRSLQFEQTPGGSMRIAVPENLGHDDLAMALMQAISCVEPEHLYREDRAAGFGVAAADVGELSETTQGLKVPTAPRPMIDVGWSWCTHPKDAERGDGW
jgi:hypothetical protein